MALKQSIWHHICKEFDGHYLLHSRCYSSKINWDKLQPMIHNRIQNRTNNYPSKRMIPVANNVFRARANLFQGVSTLLKFIPVKACKYCPEVYIGEHGHLIQTCHGFRRRNKNQKHDWRDGSLNDLLEAFHLPDTCGDSLKHDQGFDSSHIDIPAVFELCYQAGANITDEKLNTDIWTAATDDSIVPADSSVPRELTRVALETLEAWENLRLGVQILLTVCPARVCKYCSQVHVGPSMKKPHFRGSHTWKKAQVDDLVQPKIVWRRRPQDPTVLCNEGREYYGHAPAVVELCSQAGAIVPNKYHCMMKPNGLPPNVGNALVSS